MKCIKCGKSGAYIRLRTKDAVCRMCGHIEKLEDDKPKKENEK